MRRMIGVLAVVFVAVWGGVVAYRMSTEAITVLATGLVITTTVVVVGVLLAWAMRRPQQTRPRQEAFYRDTGTWKPQTPQPPVVVINPTPAATTMPGWSTMPQAGTYPPSLPPAGMPAWNQQQQRQFVVIGDE